MMMFGKEARGLMPAWQLKDSLPQSEWNTPLWVMRRQIHANTPSGVRQTNVIVFIIVLVTSQALTVA